MQHFFVRKLMVEIVNLLAAVLFFCMVYELTRRISDCPALFLFFMSGMPAIVKTQLLKNRRHVLSLDTDRSVVLWDIFVVRV